MDKYSFMPQYLVDTNEQEMHFYTHTSSCGVVTTTLWKYELHKKKLLECFEIKERIDIWKYHIDKMNYRLEYIGISFGGAASVIGLDSCGEILFRYELGGSAGTPVYDRIGNVYVSVNNVWIFCLNKQGELLWKWRPICNDYGRYSGIKNYWIANEKLYVIAVGQEYVVALDGNMERNHFIADWNENTRYVVGNNRIFFKSENSRKLLCYNFNAERIWEYGVNEDEMIFEIVVAKENIICLRVKKITDNTSRLYVIDENGKKQWGAIHNWTSLFVFPDGKITLNNGKNISIYDVCGQKLLQHNSKDYILWGRLIEEKLLMIVEGHGNTSVVQLGGEVQGEVCIAKLMAKKVVENTSSKNMLLWKKELLQYLLLNLEIWKRYFDTEIREIMISYEPFERIHMQMLTDENVWIDGMASSIPFENRLDVDSDFFKECSCRDEIVWQELCDDCSEEQIEIVVKKVCVLLSDKMNIPVKLQP